MENRIVLRLQIINSLLALPSYNIYSKYFGKCISLLLFILPHIRSLCLWIYLSKLVCDQMPRFKPQYVIDRPMDR